MSAVSDDAAQAARQKRAWKPPPFLMGRMRALARDPLVHFLILGVLLFGVSEAWRKAHDPRRIVVDHYTVEQISADYARRFGEAPSAEALRQAVASYVGDEALYREGLARGLDKGDELVRRRIVQKMQFLQDDAVAAGQPSEADLRRYYAQHLARYTWPARVSFRHLYFRTDQGEAVARARAEAARTRLAAGGSDIGIGDPFPDRTSFTRLSQADVERVFGASALPRAVFEAPVGAWTGPVASGFGMHLIRVDQRLAAEAQPFAAVHGQIVSDYRRDAQEARSRKAVAEVVARYRVVMAKDATTP